MNRPKPKNVFASWTALKFMVSFTVISEGGRLLYQTLFKQHKWAHKNRSGSILELGMWDWCMFMVKKKDRNYVDVIFGEMLHSIVVFQTFTFSFYNFLVCKYF